MSHAETQHPLRLSVDIGGGMNLLFRLKGENMAYPQIKIESDTTKKNPPLMVISDSFYWFFYSMGPSSIFFKSQFWYYNHEIYSTSFPNPKQVNEMSLKDELAKHDVILIMATEATLPNMGWGFIEQAYNAFYKRP